MGRWRLALLAAACTVPATALAQSAVPTPAAAIDAGTAQLRHVIGSWAVTTQFIAQEGGIAASFDGVYHFRWVVPDRLISGTSTIPALQQTSAILFYLRPASDAIEMTSVGADGMLWVMTGPRNGEVRETANRTMADGSSLKLRFTRYNVAPDSFESRMDVSTDDGATWRQGNHQLFRRCGSAGVACAAG